MNEAIQLVALRDVASQINAGADLVAMLEQLVRVSCHHTGWTMGSIMSVDMAEGLVRVIARYDPALLDQPLANSWELASSPSVTALQRNEPVYIRDVRESEYLGYKRESFERDYRTVLVVPMASRDFLDRPMVLSLVSRPLKEVTREDLAFLDLVVHLGAIAVERNRQLEQQRCAADRLQQVLRVHSTLLEHVLAEGSVSSLSMLVGKLMPTPLIAVDFTANLVIAGRSPDLALFDDEAWQQATSGVLGAQIASATREALNSSVREAFSLHLDDGKRRFTVKSHIEPLTVDHELVGALIVLAMDKPSIEMDRLLLDSAKYALSVQMMRSFIRFRFETRTQAELFSELVERRWKDAEDLQQRARRLHMNFSQPQQMVVVDFGPTTGKPARHTSLHHNATRLLERAGIPSTVIALETGLVCLIPALEKDGEARLNKLMRRMADEMLHYLSVEPILLASGTCTALADYPAAWARCRRMIDIARSLGRTGPLSNKDFGPMPMLVSAVGGEDIRLFVNDSLGALLEHDRLHDTHYLETLSMYLNKGCRTQACADAMGIHVTTLRYRLARMDELFALNVDTPEQRFSLELAIRLQALMADAP